MKIRSTDVCLKMPQAYGKSKTAIWAELCKRSFSAIIHRCYSILNKHLLRKTQNFFTHHVYSRVDLCSCVCWSWNFSPDESHSRPSTISSILSVFDRKFRISLKPLNLWSPKSAAIKTAILMGRIFKTWCEFINKLTFVNAYRICFIQSFDQYLLEWKPFIFEFH